MAPPPSEVLKPGGHTLPPFLRVTDSHRHRPMGQLPHVPTHLEGPPSAQPAAATSAPGCLPFQEPREGTEVDRPRGLGLEALDTAVLLLLHKRKQKAGCFALFPACCRAQSNRLTCTILCPVPPP